MCLSRLGHAYFLCLCILSRRSSNECMIEGLLIIRQIMSCMWVNIIGFQVISINKPISLLMHVLIPVVLKTLSIEILPKCSVGQVS
jgi:hypothetical protein